jgi:2-polyprenyl-3-methyl-5-hydroxy-6-metoxy-1,4-benzoquinol methylase
MPAAGGETKLDRTALLAVWRRALVGDLPVSPAEAVVGELADYFHLDPAEVERRCRDWERDSLREWSGKDRSTPEGLTDFYQTQSSWIFDTMWYHAEQTSESKPAESVDIAEGFLKRLGDWTPGNHLDFGAGPGTCSLFFHKLGWRVSLADISTTFLDFAKWRLAKHNVDARFYDTTVDEIPADEFDLITALDVMVHVPDIGATLDRLNRALKPNGYLVFNIDNRPRTELTQWHLYEEQYPILRQVRVHGYARCPKIAYFHVFQKVSRSKVAAAGVAVCDMLRYNRVASTIGKVVRAAGIRRS